MMVLLILVADYGLEALTRKCPDAIAKVVTDANLGFIQHHNRWLMVTDRRAVYGDMILTGL
jgi:hypothetical protein